MNFEEPIFYWDEKQNSMVKAITTIGFNEECVFGIYDLAERKLKAHYTKNEKCPLAQEKSKTRNKNKWDCSPEE